MQELRAGMDVADGPDQTVVHIKYSDGTVRSVRLDAAPDVVAARLRALPPDVGQDTLRAELRKLFAAHAQLPKARPQRGDRRDPEVRRRARNRRKAGKRF